jgi:hypothetical protein
MRPLKSSFSATPLDGVDGVLGVVGPVGVVGSDGESFAPPHAAMVMPHNASAAVSSLTWSDIGGGDPCFGVSDANQPKNSTSTRLATLKPGRCLYLRNDWLRTPSWRRLRADAFDAADVDRLPALIDGLEEQLVSRDFHQHEGVFAIISECGQIGFLKIPFSQFCRRADDEVRDALLRFDAFVKMLVAREHDVDAVLEEHWLQ